MRRVSFVNGVSVQFCWWPCFWGRSVLHFSRLLVRKRISLCHLIIESICLTYVWIIRFSCQRRWCFMEWVQSHWRVCRFPVWLDHIFKGRWNFWWQRTHTSRCVKLRRWLVWRFVFAYRRLNWDLFIVVIYVTKGMVNHCLCMNLGK